MHYLTYPIRDKLFPCEEFKNPNNTKIAIPKLMIRSTLNRPKSRSDTGKELFYLKIISHKVTLPIWAI